MAKLVYFTGTMDAGKSTLALQMHHNHSAGGRDGLLFSRNDRAGRARISTRLGLARDAYEVEDDTDFVDLVVELRTRGRRVDFLVCDEAQFYSAEQVDQLARVVDELGADVFAFGILTDFRTRMFPGSARLVELADAVEVLQLEKLCWCGARATHNARTVGGRMVVEGAQVVVGDTDPDQRGAGADEPEDERVEYEVLCRDHHRRGLTARSSRAAVASPATLPFELE